MPSRIGPQGVAALWAMKVALMDTLPHLVTDGRRRDQIAPPPRPPTERATFHLDAGGRCLALTPEAAHCLGQPRTALLGHNLWNVLPPGTLEARLSHLLREVAVTHIPTTSEGQSSRYPARQFWTRVTPTIEDGLLVALKYIPELRPRTVTVTLPQAVRRFAPLVLLALGVA